MPVDLEPEMRADAAPTLPPRPGRFYGWWVVFALLVVLTFSSGLGFYNLSVILAALASEGVFSVADASIATAVFFVTSGLSGLAVAFWIERHDPRLVMAPGAVLSALCLAVLGRVEELWQLHLVYAIFGLGFSATSLVPATTLVTRWFVRRRSVALSIASTGLSLGGVLITPLSARLIADVGLAASTPWLGLVYLAGIAPIAILVLRPDPGSMGLLPDGGAKVGGPPDGSDRFVGFRVAIASRFFLATTAAYVFVMLAQVGGIAHQFKLISDRANAELAAVAVSSLAACSIAGRLAGGWLLTRLPMRPFALALMLLQGFSLFLLALAEAPRTLVAASMLFGLSVGNLLMLQPLLLAEAFGARHYPRIYSLGNVVTMIGVAAGPVLLGLLRDRLGSYAVAFLVAGSASLIAILFFAVAGDARPREA